LFVCRWVLTGLRWTGRGQVQEVAIDKGGRQKSNQARHEKATTKKKKKSEEEKTTTPTTSKMR
jgi:hypothetical protein